MKTKKLKLMLKSLADAGFNNLEIYRDNGCDGNSSLVKQKAKISIKKGQVIILMRDDWR